MHFGCLDMWGEAEDRMRASDLLKWARSGRDDVSEAAAFVALQAAAELLLVG